MSNSAKRILKEVQRLQQEPIPDIKIIPNEEMRYFQVYLKGPKDTPYYGIFHLELYLPDSYPMEPPKIRFLTKVYHPNIDMLGRICLDILKDKWTPALQIRTVLLSIQALLSAPNPDDPLNNQVAKEYKDDLELAMKTAKKFTQEHALKDFPNK
eukprot:NODE_250_length_12902_cov_0.423182.p6 type:complete len:154 gc:universal NODE_250_length_12902_cov_0.423182:4388-3927(-)